MFGREVETWDENEQERLEHIEEYVFPVVPGFPCGLLG